MKRYIENQFAKEKMGVLSIIVFENVKAVTGLNPSELLM